MLATRGLGAHATLVLWGLGGELAVVWPTVEPGLYAVSVGENPVAGAEGASVRTEDHVLRLDVAVDDGPLVATHALAQPTLAVAVEVDG